MTVTVARHIILRFGLAWSRELLRIMLAFLALVHPGPLDRRGSLGCRHTRVPAWPYGVSSQIKFVSFLNSLHWPAVVDDLGRDGISYVELLLQCELWAEGETSS